MLGMTTITVTPHSGSWAEGDYSIVAGDSYTVRASVQSASARTLQMLDEGARTSIKYVMYVSGVAPILKTTDLSASPRTPADRVTYNGKTYLVAESEDFSCHNTGLSHRQYLLLEESES